MALLAQPAAARIVKSDCSITFKGKLVLELKKVIFPRFGGHPC
jgi:hypothetical protein